MDVRASASELVGVILKNDVVTLCMVWFTSFLITFFYYTFYSCDFFSPLYNHLSFIYIIVLFSSFILFLNKRFFLFCKGSGPEFPRVVRVKFGLSSFHIFFFQLPLSCAEILFFLSN